MQGTVRCTSCHKLFRLPDALLGKPVQCPDCATIFTAPHSITAEPPAPVPPPRPAGWGPPPLELPSPGPPPVPASAALARGLSDDQLGEDERAAPRPVPDDRDVWRGVGLGDGLYTLAHTLYAAGLLLLLLFFLVTLDSVPGSRTRRPSEVIAALLALLFSLGLLGNWVLAVVAPCFWVQAPAGAHARPLALALLALGGLVLLRVPDVIGLLVGVLDHDDRFLGGPGRLAAMALATYLLEGARLTLLAFFLNAAGQHLRRAPVALGAKLLAGLTPCVLGGLFLLDVLVLLVDRTGKVVWVFVLFFHVVGQVGLLVWGSLLLVRVWDAVGRAPARPEE
jgi:hypothetical protein